MFRGKLGRISGFLGREDVNPWLLVLILATLLSAPAGTLTRMLTGELNPFVIASVRYAIVSLVLVPIFIKNFRKYKAIIRKNWKPIVIFGFLASFGAPAYMLAIASSSASFVAILDLLTPIMFIIVSTLVTRDKFSRNAVIGILFAVLGGSVILLMPLIFDWSFMNVGWAAVAAMLVFIVIDAGWPVVLRKVNSNGVPLVMILAIAFFETFVVSTGFALASGGVGVYEGLVELPLWGWASLVFKALVLSIAVRWLNTKAYERLGTATTASVSYLHYALGIGLPILLLGEKVPVEILVGAVLIVTGIIFVRRHPHLRVHRPGGHR
jgi:drug/metabolite transporter (DMT)-like permease